MLVVADFIFVELSIACLHRSSFLLGFIKVHHSVEEMGFAAHLQIPLVETDYL